MTNIFEKNSVKSTVNEMKKTPKEYLDFLAQSLATLRESDPLKTLGGLFSPHNDISISVTTSAAKEWTLDFKKGLAEWFADGELTSYRTTSTPYGERKNSKKKITTVFFFGKRDGFTIQFGHLSTKNYNPSFWERGGELLVQSAMCVEGEFSYHNHSYVNHILSLGGKFTDLGEKK